MTLDGAHKRMKDNLNGTDKRVEVIEKLTSIKEKLMEIAKGMEGAPIIEEDEQC
mgnify:FL=1